MYNEEEIEDSLAFCRDIKRYYEKDSINQFNYKAQKQTNQTIYETYPTFTGRVERNKPRTTLFGVIVREGFHILICIAIAFVVSQFITHYIGQHTMVEGMSMEDTLHNGDYLIIDKLSYRFQEPKRFDIIVFPFHKDYYIKRIIGMPKDLVEIVDGDIYINGELLYEDYGKEAMASGMNQMDPIVLGADEYFVLGDNRNNSHDSRYSDVGLIQKDEIIGRAWCRIYPLDSIGILPHQ